MAGCMLSTTVYANVGGVTGVRVVIDGTTTAHPCYLSTSQVYTPLSPQPFSAVKANLKPQFKNCVRLDIWQATPQQLQAELLANATVSMTHDPTCQCSVDECFLCQSVVLRHGTLNRVATSVWCGFVYRAGTVQFPNCTANSSP